MSVNAVQKKRFDQLDVRNPFFDSLRVDYKGFDNWFKKKSREKAQVLVTYDDDELEGFLYLKDEDEGDDSIIPRFPKKRRLKIGTFKINAHGTILGQRFMTIILRKMIREDFSESYVTFFKKQLGICNLVTKFGYICHGQKDNGELVYVKDLKHKDNIYLDFPRVNLMNSKKALLAIKPEYHTQMFPDSKLNTESEYIIEDLSHTNTIEKVYISGVRSVNSLQKGDLLVMYRTKEKDSPSPAEYNSVATSICTVVEVKNIKDFSSEEDYLMYTRQGSVYDDIELKSFYKNRKLTDRYCIKMLYNFPLNKRIIRQKLADDVGLNRSARWAYMNLSEEQFNQILKVGEVNEGFIIN